MYLYIIHSLIHFFNHLVQSNTLMKYKQTCHFIYKFVLLFLSFFIYFYKY